MTETSRELRLKFERALNRAKLKVLRDHPKTLAIVVNGSVGRGEEQAHSDIDLLIIVNMGPNQNHILTSTRESKLALDL